MANWFEENAPLTQTKKSWFAENAPPQATDYSKFSDRVLNPSLNAQRTEARIAQRPDILKEAVSQPLSHLEASIPMIRPLKFLGGLIQRGTGAIVNPMIEAQQGRFNPKTLLKSSVKGLTGERPGELGDIYTGAGFGEKSSAALGLGTELALTAPEALVNAPKILRQSPKYLGELGGRIKEQFAKPRFNPVELAEQGFNKASLNTAENAQAMLAKHLEGVKADLTDQYAQVVKNAEDLGVKANRTDVLQALGKTLEDRGLIGYKARAPQSPVEAHLLQEFNRYQRMAQGGVRHVQAVVSPSELMETDAVIRKGSFGDPFGKEAINAWRKNSDALYDAVLPDLKPVRANWKAAHDWEEEASKYFHPEATETDLAGATIKKGEGVVKRQATGKSAGTGEEKFLKEFQRRTGADVESEPLKAYQEVLKQKSKADKIKFWQGVGRKAIGWGAVGAAGTLGYKGVRHL